MDTEKALSSLHITTSLLTFLDPLLDGSTTHRDLFHESQVNARNWLTRRTPGLRLQAVRGSIPP